LGATDSKIKAMSTRRYVIAAALFLAALPRQISAQMEEQRISQSAMAKKMHTSRAALDRLLDPENDSVTLNTLFKAATAVGRQIYVELV
jgi:antitoxin HicB